MVGLVLFFLFLVGVRMMVQGLFELEAKRSDHAS
jgi:hypothetical protein